MPTEKIAISIDEDLLEELDSSVKAGLFSSRSQAVRVAVKEKLDRLAGHRLAEECAKLDPGFEQALAEESFAGEVEAWPEY